jgi:hypothetical protein
MAKGPAPRGEYVGKSSVFSTRITPDLRKKLEQAAKRSGRSVSQEVESRLDRTFTEDDAIADRFGDRRTYVLMRMMADAIHFGHKRGNPLWLESPLEFEKAISAALLVLEAIRPDGDLPTDALTTRHHQVQGERVALNIWRAIKRADLSAQPTQGTNADHKNRMKKRDLGGLADRALEPSKTKED